MSQQNSALMRSQGSCVLTNVGMSFATAWQPGSSAQYPLLYKVSDTCSGKSPLSYHDAQAGTAL